MKNYRTFSFLRVAATIAAALLCCTACLDTDDTIGANLVPAEKNLTFYYTEHPITDISIKMADSLSGYSSTRITVGAVSDPDFGITGRSAAITLVPMFVESLDMGQDPVLKSFHFTMQTEGVNYTDESQKNILQRFNVYELEKALDPVKNFDCNTEVRHKDTPINKGCILFDGTDTLSFNFTDEFAHKYLSMTNDDVRDMKTYLSKFPGIYIETENPAGGSGRINLFNLQLGYSATDGTLLGDIAILDFNASFDGERKDTSLFFYFSALDFYDIDSLLTYSSTGSFPQYGLNLTKQNTGGMVGKVDKVIPVEGGGGLKPVISAKHLKHLAEEAISRKGGDPREAIINKATLVFPFKFPENYKDMDLLWPAYLSPTVKITTDTSANFVGITDASSESENRGDVNRSLCRYAPDITFHLQELLSIDESDRNSQKTRRLEKGDFDIWLLIMANEAVTTTTAASSQSSDYYDYMAYQSYYNSMYNGYGGYGDPYSNYYNYMMMSSAASTPTTTTTYTVQLDINRFYKAYLNGPGSDDGPRLELTFALPTKE